MPERVLHSPTRAGRLGFVPPLLPTLASEPPTGANWLHEIKHDGYRTLLVIEDRRVRAFTRNGHDWTERYSRAVAAAGQLPCWSAIVDGEMVVQDQHGLSDFNALRRAMSAEPHRLVFFAFDLLHLDGNDLQERPLLERKAKLNALLGAPDPFAAIQFSDHIERDGDGLFAAAAHAGLEGIVSKQAASRYRSGSSRVWLKAKCETECEFVVVGAEPNPGGPPYALLAREEEGGLVYVGAAFVTLPQEQRNTFWERSEGLKIRKPVRAEGLDTAKRKVSWFRPEMRVLAKHLRGGDMLRHARLTAVVS